MYIQRDIRVCYDLVEFLTYHMHDVGLTQQHARDLSRTMRMTDTRDLKHLHGIDYLEAREILTDEQRHKFVQLVLEVRTDPAYADEHEYVQAYARVFSTRPRTSKFKSSCYPWTVVSLARRLL
jgi:hypothetical protein